MNFLCLIFGHKPAAIHIDCDGFTADFKCSRCGELHRHCEVRGNRIVNTESDTSKPAKGGDGEVQS